MSAEEEATYHRVTADMTVTQALEHLAEHGVKVWHMLCEPLGEIVMFVGQDASLMRAKALGAIYGEHPSVAAKRQ